MARTATSARPRRRERKNITSGVAHVAATFNNTVITITDVKIFAEEAEAGGIE